MVTEYRKIAFSNEDLIVALIDFDRKRAKQFAPGRKMTCSIKDEEPVGAILSIADPAGGAPNVFEFDSNHLAAVLLCFCIDRKVPIPKQAKKVLRAMGDGLSLNFKLDL